VPRIFHSFRPPWYSERVSREVGRTAGVAVRPSFADDNIGYLWSNKKAAVSHPMAQRRLVPVRPPSKDLSPQIKLDSKSLSRSEMFARQGFEIAARGRENYAEGAERTGSRNRGLTRQWHSANAARMMHEFNSPERVFRSAYHFVKPNPTLPYKPATTRSGRVPTPPRPSSGASPRIAGTAAAAILKGTGALGALPAIIHLARGRSLGSLAGPLPPQFGGYDPSRGYS
jgi:hypothetical protein